MANNRLPASTFNAQYPFNAVTVSRSGHEFHVDDTPGHERLRQAHKSGTFFEVSADGRKVELVVGDDYKYVKGGLTLTVENNGDIKIAGNLRLVVEGDVQAEVYGNMNTVVSGDSTVATLGDSVQMIGGDAVTKVEGSMTAKVDSNLNVKVEKDAEIDVKGDTSIVGGGSIDMEASSVRIKADSDVTIRGASVNIVRGL
jgi:hypothetical protein